MLRNLCLSLVYVPRYGPIEIAIYPSSHLRSKLDAKGIKYLLFKICERRKIYRLIFLETEKIIKSLEIVFCKDKTHMEERPSGRSIEVSKIKVDISTKSYVEELEVNGNILELDEVPDKKPNMKDNVLTTTSTHSGKASKVDANKKLQPNFFQYLNMQ